MSFLDFVFQHFEPILQGILLLGLVCMTWVEMRYARLIRTKTAWDRWQTNLVLYLVGAMIISLSSEYLSKTAIEWGGALQATSLAALTWPTWVKLMLGVLLIDFAQYLLHVVSHRLPWLWRLHKIHHSDTFMDATTSLRHHPLESWLISFLLLLICAATGVPVLAIMLYAVVQIVHGLFCHSNIQLPDAVDRRLRSVLITPAMHVLHHSVQIDESNSNYGMVFPWWDRLLGTYRHKPSPALNVLRLGIDELDASPPQRVMDLLLLPFRHPRT